MAMEISNNYSYYASSYENTVDNKKRTTESSTTKETPETSSTTKKTAAKAGSGEKTSNEEYLSELNKRHSSLNIMAGGVNKNYNSGNYPNKVDVMIAPSILAKMASDPKEAQKYEKMLSDIPMCEKWANSAIKAMTGNEVKYRQVWIDENGNMGSFSISGPSENQQKMDAQRKENEKKAFEERLEKAREKSKENAAQLEERLEKKREASLKAEKLLSEKLEKARNGEIYLDNEDMQTIIEAAKGDDTGKADTKGNMTIGANLDLKA